MKTQGQFTWVIRQGLAIAFVTPLVGFVWGMVAAASPLGADELKAGVALPSAQGQFPELRLKTGSPAEAEVVGPLAVNCLNYRGTTFKFLECHRVNPALGEGGPNFLPPAASVLRWHGQERLVTEFDSNFPDNTVSSAKRGEVQFIF